MGVSCERGTPVGAGVLGFECRVQGCKVQGGGWRVEVSGLAAVGLGLRVWRLWFGCEGWCGGWGLGGRGLGFGGTH